MKIKTYLDYYYPNKLKYRHLISNHRITNITSDYKEVSRGSVYFHFKNNECLNYIEEAIKNKAFTIFISNECQFKTNKLINIIKVDNPKIDMARLNYLNYLEKYHHFPTFIGVTGTTGKTTVSTLIFETLRKMSHDVLLISSSGIFSYYASTLKRYKTNNTTPSNAIIYKYMMENEMPYDFVIIEVSSQGISDFRVSGIKFDYSIVTNFKKEHLEYYQDEESYFLSKKKLILNTSKHIFINKEIEKYNKFIEDITIPYTSYGINDGDITSRVISSNLFSNEFLIKYKNKTFNINSKLIGKFNICNILSVFSLFVTLGYKPLDIINILENIDNVNGRMNVFKHKGVNIIVDYAHSKLALEHVLSFLNDVKERKLITVIGAGGLRDKENRSFIGSYVTSNCDFVVITEDNSRTEDLDNIINDITKDIKSNNYHIEKERKFAIDYALKNSSEGDIVAVLGKGDEEYIIKDKPIYFSDLEYIKKVVSGNYE